MILRGLDGSLQTVCFLDRTEIQDSCYYIDVNVPTIFTQLKAACSLYQPTGFHCFKLDDYWVKKNILPSLQKDTLYK
jgi:hypothetical protein